MLGSPLNPAFMFTAFCHGLWWPGLQDFSATSYLSLAALWSVEEGFMISSPLQLSGFLNHCSVDCTAKLVGQFRMATPRFEPRQLWLLCVVLFLFLIFSRNRELFRLSSFTSWKLTWEVFCPLHTIPIVVLQPRKSGCHSLMAPLSLTSQLLFRHVHCCNRGSLVHLFSPNHTFCISLCPTLSFSF